ncbi:amidohydrolase [Cutibacterium sp. WCA-380-WT-3A]|uniref:Amidohydrolase n=1 Tax=Cutibacterium porci TaxID=2605781 RepID=A0A7K0J454_9ACTN|nr:M20 family metallopeptidase [Cutibacterium porci]MSS44702.1 amidohydrolase [Cutibacterium porci]
MNSRFLDAMEDDLVALRHELHGMPELGLHLPRTQARLLRELEGLPLEISTGKELTSITAVLRGRGTPAGERRAVLLRADMDALPVKERTGLSWASTNGSMHACGHDCHMTCLVGAVRGLCERIDDLPGDVVFMFQPGEEGQAGARRMIKEGVLEASGHRVDAAYALHVWSGMDHAGTYHCRPGTIMASSDDLTVIFEGRGGHGSAPHLTHDPVPAAAEFVLALHTMVARRFNIFDPVVVTAGHLEAGTARNVIPEDATVEATLRAFSSGAREKLFSLIPEVAYGVARAHGVTAHINLDPLYPTTVNHPDSVEAVRRSVTELFGSESWVNMPVPMGAAEDFSLVLQEVPGAFIILPATKPGTDPADAQGNHSAHAYYDDSVLVSGATLLADLAVRELY